MDNNVFKRTILIFQSVRQDMRKSAMITLIKSIESQKDFRSQVLSLRERFDRYSNLKLVDEVKILKEECKELNQKVKATEQKQFMLLSRVVPTNYKFKNN